MKHKFKKGDKVRFRDSLKDGWVEGYFSYKKGNYFFCYIYGDHEYNVLPWGICEPFEDEKPEPQEQPIQIPGLVHFRLCTLTDTELAKAVSDKLQAVYDNKMSANNLLSRHVPARPNEDFDLLVGELIFRLLNKK